MQDTSKLFIDFTKCPKGTKLVDYFDELSGFSEFKCVKDENIIKIAILTCDKESDFMLRIKDRKMMLEAIFSFLSINIETRKNKELFDAIFKFEHEQYMDCIGRYLMIYHDIDWASYVSAKQTFEIIVLESFKPKQKEEDIGKFVDRKKKVQGHLKSAGDELKELEAKIFPDSKTAKEFAKHQSKRIITYAEKYAEENTYV